MNTSPVSSRSDTSVAECAGMCNQFTGKVQPREPRAAVGARDDEVVGTGCPTFSSSSLWHQRNTS